MHINEERIYDLEKNLAIVVKDVAQYEQYQDKFSIAIDKLTEISNNLAKMVSIHGSVIDNHGKLVDELYNKLERVKDSGENELKSISKNISTLETHNNDIHYDLISKIENIKNEFNGRIDTILKDIDKRMKQTEKYIWMFLGAGTLLGFLSSYIVPIAVKLIH